MRKMKKVYFIILLTLLTASALFAHGKGDIEDIAVENMNSLIWISANRESTIS